MSSFPRNVCSYIVPHALTTQVHNVTVVPGLNKMAKCVKCVHSQMVLVSVDSSSFFMQPSWLQWPDSGVLGLSDLRGMRKLTKGKFDPYL